MSIAILIMQGYGVKMQIKKVFPV